ncbi:MAG: OST3/OST6 family protein [Spirochaetaceae bacterium]|nr:OST3/OST6 family protein [Spirochaetaceae bacterium]
MNYKLAIYLILLLIITFFTACIIYLGADWQMVLVPVFIASLYFNKLWLVTAIAIGWVFAFGPNGGLFWLPFVLALRDKALKRYHIAFTLILVSIIVKNILLDINVNTIVIVVVTYLSGYLFILEDKDILTTAYRQKLKIQKRDIRLVLFAISLFITFSLTINHTFDFPQPVLQPGGWVFFAVPLMITGFYLKNLWATTAAVIVWLSLFGAEGGYYWLPFVLSHKKATKFSYFVAFLMVMLAVMVRRWFDGTANLDIFVGIIMFLNIFTFTLVNKGLFKIKYQSKQEKEQTKEAKRQHNERLSAAEKQEDAATNSDKMTTVILTNLKMTAVAKRILIETCLNGKGDKNVLKEGYSGDKASDYYTKEYVSNERADVLAYNNLNDKYELIVYLKYDAVTVIKEYDEELLNKGKAERRRKKREQQENLAKWQQTQQNKGDE